jgi:hydrogenase/urease accessory protein HupE
MPKALCILAMAVAGLLVLLFGLDLGLSVPFGRESIAMDVGFVIASVLLGYVGWATWREQV